MQAGEVLDELGELSRGQWGMFTSTQARIAEVTAQDLARTARRGLVRRVRHGVYAMHGSSADALEEVRAEWLATDPSRMAGKRRQDQDPVVVSDESAALVHGFGDVASDLVHFTTTRRLRPSAKTPVRAHQRKVSPKEITWIDGLPTTSVRRTLEDLAAKWEVNHIRDAIADAVRLGLLPAHEIARSPRLLEISPELAPPATHAGLKQRLKNAAPERATRIRGRRDRAGQPRDVVSI